MNIITLFETFKTEQQAIEYLEKIRWRGSPHCPYCDSNKICRHVSNDRKHQRWQCQDCTKAFSVTVGTIFHRTHIPLRSWFLVIALMLNAKKSASACQISRDVGIRRPTVWSMMHRIRKAMANDEKQKELLCGIVEADETYIGGKPRKGDKKENKRGRGTKKTPVLGVVERNGNVYAEVSSKKALNQKGLSKFISNNIDTSSSLLITDQYKGYTGLAKIVLHAVINHSKSYVEGIIHTNTIEGFWALVKRAFYGQHHHYSKRYAPLYIAESCYKYNYRKVDCSFNGMLSLMIAA